MADKFELEFSGWEELQETILNITNKMEKQAFSQTLRYAAKEFAKAVKDEAPKGETGVLGQGPKVRALRRKKNRIGFSAKYQRTEDNKFYATSVDRGAKNSGKSKVTIQPNPFMERAFDKTAPRLADELPKVMADKIEALIQKENKTP